MKLNRKILSIPPYVSTSWKHVASLHVLLNEEAPVLVVTLINGTQIEIPELQPSLMEAIFACHVHSMEAEEKRPSLPSLFPSALKQEQLFSFKLPFKLEEMNLEGLSPLGGILQHNAEQSHGPDLPNEILARLGELAKTIGLEDPEAIPKAEPHCNCFYCQIANALHKGICPSEAPPEEIVTDEELKFRTWDISQAGERLYTVANPCDAQENYSVFLGDPVGCTCGQRHCEHIRAVLDT